MQTTRLSQFPYSFASRRADPPVDLTKFLALSAAAGLVLLEPAPWEPTDRWVGGIKPRFGHLSADDFYTVVPYNADIRQAGLHLCGRLIAFSLRFLERTAEAYRVSHGGQIPNAEQLLEEVNALAANAVDDRNAEVWLYHEATQAPAVILGVTNAFNDRWNREHPCAGRFAPFEPSEHLGKPPEYCLGAGAKVSKRRSTTRISGRVPVSG